MRTDPWTARAEGRVFAKLGAEALPCAGALAGTGGFITRCQPRATAVAPSSTTASNASPAIRLLKRQRSGGLTVAVPETTGGIGAAGGCISSSFSSGGGAAVIGWKKKKRKY